MTLASPTNASLGVRPLAAAVVAIGLAVAGPAQAPAKTPDRVQDALEAVTPAPFRRHAHHWLILHGRYVCKARRPECWRCIVRDLCAFEPKTPAPKVTADA